jgi:hypothetical protein
VFSFIEGIAAMGKYFDMHSSAKVELLYTISVSMLLSKFVLTDSLGFAVTNPRYRDSLGTQPHSARSRDEYRESPVVSRYIIIITDSEFSQSCTYVGCSRLI